MIRTVEKKGCHSGSINCVLWDCEGIIVLIAKAAVFISLKKNDQIYKSFAWNFLWASQFSFLLPFMLEIQWPQELKVSVPVGSHKQPGITLYLFNFDSHILDKFPLDVSTETYWPKTTRKQISASFTVHCKFWLHLTPGGTKHASKTNRSWHFVKRFSGKAGSVC